ncbi:hypothetical protein IKD56_00880 [bacterium]|nr:hypothetical protein [bacterium]
MIKLENGNLEIGGENTTVLAEFLMIYKYLELDYAKHGLNFRSILLPMIFDKEFEKLKTKEERKREKIINLKEYKKNDM